MPCLVIVESPAKANTIKNYLGSNYKVIASVGHVRDLPKSTLGVDIENGFAAKYINIRGKGALIKELKKEAKNATKIYLATDPDREGEAISWHLAATLNIPLDQTRRITFNEVTKAAVKSAIKAPRNINMDLVNSQQARRILDRIVGYKLSPFLWKTVRSGLSAGRVQSVATRIIVERENEIRSFVSDEYWTIDAMLQNPSGKPFTAHYYGNQAGKAELHSEKEAAAVVSETANGRFTVTSVKKATRYRHPAPPFTTSTLQQEASKKLGFQSARIMRVAQELYEGVNIGSAYGGVHGLITYMRTDSLRISADATEMAKQYIIGKYGEKAYPENPRVFKMKANAQDAHEAIRPANLEYEPDKLKKYLTQDQYKLYKLIWSRFIASQMASAEIDTVNVELQCRDHLFRANGNTVRFPGFMSVYDTAEDGDAGKAHSLPELKEQDVLTAEAVKPEQHFTEPPPRYNEASLIKFLEEKGIGRPSTYTPIITTILQRGYVEREGKSLKPTPLGEVTTKIMEESFPDIVDYAFTAKMENDLDSIENGEETMLDVLSSFYEKFAADLEKAEQTVSKETIQLPVEETDMICEKCGSRMIVKSGRFGKFAACPNYPACKNTKPLSGDGKATDTSAEPTDMICEKCGAPMVKRKGKYGEFLACSTYPICKNTKQLVKEIGVSCPLCGNPVIVRRSRNHSVYYACENHPACDFLSWDQPTDQKCPNCGKPLYIKKGKHLLICHEKKCGYKKEMPDEEQST